MPIRVTTHARRAPPAAASARRRRLPATHAVPAADERRADRGCAPRCAPRTRATRADARRDRCRPRVALRPARRRSTSTKPVSNSGTTRISTTSTDGPTETPPASRNTGTSETPAEHRADEQAAAVAHEEPRRRTIPVQEPEQRAGQRDEQQHERRARATAPRSHARNAAAMSATPAGQAVHVVEQVERVAHAGEPDGARRACTSTAARRRARPGQREDEERADGERGDELGQRRQLQAIVEDADDEHRQRRPAAPAAHAVGQHRSRRRCHDHAEAEQRARRDRDPAHRRRRRAVPAIGARRHDGADRRAPRGERRAPSASEATSAISKRERRAESPSVEGSGALTSSAACRPCRAGRTASRRGCRRRSYPVPADAPGSSCCRRSSLSR